MSRRTIRPRRVLWASLAFLGVLSAFVIGHGGCRGDDASPNFDYEILLTLVGGFEHDPQWRAIVAGARAQAADLGRLRVEARPRRVGSARTVDDEINAALEAGAKVIGVWRRHPFELTTRPSAVARRGAFLIPLGLPIESEIPIAGVRVDWPAAAEMLAEALPALLGEKRTLVLLHERSRDARSEGIYHRFVNVINAQQRIVLLAERDAAAHQATGRELLREMLGEFEHAGLAVSLTPTPWLPPRPEWALPRETPFATLSAAPPLWPYLERGAARALIGPVDGQIGRLFVDQALKAISGEAGDSGVRFVPCEVVTSENLDDFAARYRAAAGSLAAN